MKKKNKFFLVIIVLLLLIISFFIINWKKNTHNEVSNLDTNSFNTGNLNNPNFANINSSTWEIDQTHDKNWRLVLNNKNWNDLFTKDSLIWDLIKDINLNDFNNLKLLQNSNWKTDNEIVIKWEILEQIYQNLVIIKSIKDQDISYCDKLNYMDATLVSQDKYCKWEFYINQLLFNKDKNICTNFDSWFDKVALMWSKISLRMMCDKLYTLVIDKNVNEQKILNFFKYIYKWWNVDDNTLNIFKTYFLNENYCTNIDVLSTKIKCLNYFYKDSFFVDFKKKAYQDIIKSKYLYE